MGERWATIERLYHEALARAEGERAAFLERECRDDEALRREVQSLLHRAASAERFLETPAAWAGGPALGGPSTPILTGLRLGVYEVQVPLGAGGMGVVYRALDTNLNRPVAIKFLSDEVADPAARRRFQREAQTASSLNHPHILTVHDAGEFEGRQYLVTELVDGGTLRDWDTRREARLAPDRRVADRRRRRARRGASSRHPAPRHQAREHSRSPRAATPSWPTSAWRNFTKPRHADDATRTVNETRTRAGIIVGTIAYMSPEQASGQPLDARSDIFSFGVVLYEALAGQRPFAGASDLDVLHAIIHAPAGPLPDDVPLPLRMVVEKALEKDPADRFQSMRDMVVDLRRVVRQSAEAAGANRDTVVVPSAHGVGWRRSPHSSSSSRLRARCSCPDSGNPPSRLDSEYTQLTNFADSATQPALSPDGRMLAFIRGESTFCGPGQIYVKLLPDGEPVQLTHDNLDKMSPKFSPDGARIAYTTLAEDGRTLDTWIVPVLGGQPRLFLTNASGLTWIRERSRAPPVRPWSCFPNSPAGDIRCRSFPRRRAAPSTALSTCRPRPAWPTAPISRRIGSRSSWLRWTNARGCPAG